MLRIQHWSLSLFSKQTYWSPQPCILFLVYMYIGVLPSCICMLTSWTDQKRASNLLELELQMVVGYHVSSGNWTHVLWTSVKVLLTTEQYRQPLWFFFLKIFMHMQQMLLISESSIQPLGLWRVYCFVLLRQVLLYLSSWHGTQIPPALFFQLLGL